MAGGEAFRADGNRTVRPAQEVQAGRAEAEAPPPGGEASPRASPTNLSILLDVVDAMPDDMLSDCRDERPPQERNGL